MTKPPNPPRGLEAMEARARVHAYFDGKLNLDLPEVRDVVEMSGHGPGLWLAVAIGDRTFASRMFDGPHGGAAFEVRAA
jgi:hypothetical protein